MSQRRFSVAAVGDSDEDPLPIDGGRGQDGARGARSSTRTLTAALAALPQMDIAQLRRHFAQGHGREAPASFSRQLLTYAVAYQLQAQVLGGLSAVMRKQLLALAKQEDGAAAIPPRTPKLSAGARLIREWRGVVHEVQILEDGVLWNGQKYRSLSTVARAITGTHCSGPRFFWLRGKTPPT